MAKIFGTEVMQDPICHDYTWSKEISKTLQSAHFSGIDRRLAETEKRLEDAEHSSAKFF